MNLNELAKRVHKQASKSGFWETDCSILATFNMWGGVEYDEHLCNMQLKRLALIHSEVSEMAEAVRKPARSEHIATSQEAEEAADVLIRLLDYCYYFGIDLDNAVKLKMKFNSKRPYKHGKKA